MDLRKSDLIGAEVGTMRFRAIGWNGMLLTLGNVLEALVSSHDCGLV